jgi:RHS repeat-associated protein
MQGHPREIWDGRGTMTVSFYLDGSGSPSEVRYVDGSNCIYDRLDENGSEEPDWTRIHNPNHNWLFKKKDEREQYTKYFPDTRRRVKRIEYPDDSFEEFTYNNFNQVRTHRMPSGATQHYDYDEYQRLWREWNDVDGEDNFTRYEYDALERVALVQNPLARSRNKAFSAKMEYDGRHLVTKVTYPATGSGNDPFVTYQYDRYGNCTNIIDELGHLKSFTYDPYRRCTSYAEQAGSSADCISVPFRRWNWYYDRVIDYGNGAVSNPPLFASSHTSKEWRIQIEPEFNADRHRRATSRVFDANNRMISEETGLVQLPGEPLGTLHAVPVTETHRVTYDEDGQKSRFTDQFERRTDYVYNNRNWLWKSIEHPMPGSTETVRTTETLYNRAGNKIQVTFPDGKMQQWPDLDYDAFEQPRVFIDERQQTTNMEYWHWGPMKKLHTVTTHRTTDDNQLEHRVTTFDYDGMGRPQWTTFPDTTTEQSVYEFGQLSAFKTRRDQTKRLHYDARGREDWHTWDSQAAPGVNRLWDDANRLTKISNSYSIIDYSYDEAGQVSTEKTTVTGSGAPREVRYCRYPSGDVSRVTYPDNSTVVNRNYTARGQLERASWSGGTVDYTYLRDGKLDYEDYGNGVRSDLAYNGRGFVNLTNTYRQSPVQTYAKRDYWRDERDRIKGWKKGNDAAANPKENGRGDRYDYDEEGQMYQASYQVNNPLVGGDGAERADSFNYDELGNRAGWNHVASRGEMLVERRDNKLNQYESWNNNFPNPPQHWGSAIYHDDNWSPWWVPPGNGVTIADGWITASYNALNQPVAMGNIAYGNNYMWFWYDPLGRCVKRWIGTGDQTPAGPTTYFYYDGWNLIQEGSIATAVDRIYVHGNRMDEIVASAAGGSWLYHHYDARGHCILQTDAASGGLQEQYDYDAFGWPYFYTAAGAQVPQSQSGNRFLFTGREFLSDMRIYDYRNRMYQPELGRFLQPDPKQFAAGDYNLYRYCHNDPVNRNDPMGLFDRSNDDPEKAKPVLVKDTYRPVLGSHIPAHIRVFSSGNWNDKVVAHHASSNLYQETGKGGLTLPSGSSNVSGNNVDLTLHVDWYYDKGFEGTNAITRELQDHVQDARSLAVRYWTGAAAASLDHLRNFSGIVSGFNIQQKLKYDQPSGSHNLEKHPAVSTSVPEQDPTRWE